MEKIFEIIERNLPIANVAPLEERYALLSKYSKKLDLGNNPKVDDVLYNRLCCISYKDFIYANLLIFFDLTNKQLEEYYNLLDEFISSDIPDYEKEKIVLFAIGCSSMENKSDGNKLAGLVSSITSFTKSGLIKSLGDNGEKIFDCLKKLSSTEYFYNIYSSIMDCYAVRDNVFDVNIVRSLSLNFQIVSDVDKIEKKIRNDKYLKKYRKPWFFIVGCVRVGGFLTRECRKLERKINNIKKDNTLNQQKISKLRESTFRNGIIDLSFIERCRKIIINDQEFNKLLVEVLRYNCNVINDIKNNSFDEDKKIELLLKKYCYDFSKFSLDVRESLKSNWNSDVCDRILGIFSNINIRFTYDNLGKLLLYGKLEVINRILSSISMGYIDEEFINNNIEVLYCEEIQLRVLANIDTLLNSELNIYDVIESDNDILMKDHNMVKNNLILLQRYGISIKNKKIFNYGFLADSESLGVIDAFIEKRLFSVIKKNPEYITKDNLIAVKRMHINRLIHNKIMNNGAIISSILDGKGYFLEDDELDDYLCSHVDNYINEKVNDILDSSNNNVIVNNIFSNDVVLKLDSEYLFEDHYLFGNVVISRIKFLRNYSTILNSGDEVLLKDAVFSCLVKNSYLTDYELGFIKECVENIIKELTFVKK